MGFFSREADYVQRERETLKYLKRPTNRNTQKPLFNHTKESHSLHILGTFVFFCIYKR